MEQPISELDYKFQAEAKLVLWVALSSHQIDEGLNQAFRNQNQQAGDDNLIAALAWGSFTAARRIGNRLTPSSASL